MSADYPTLTDMGIRSFDEVSHFKVRHEHNADVLKIYYRRTKNPLLPRSKKFTFVRPRTAVPLQYRDRQDWQQFKDSSPRLQAAIKELTQLTRPAVEVEHDPKTKFLNDLDHLEKVMLAKIDEIRSQVDRMT